MKINLVPRCDGQIEFFKEGDKRDEKTRVFADPDLTVELPNPLQIRSDGTITPIYIADDPARYVVRDPDGETVCSIDMIIEKN